MADLHDVDMSNAPELMDGFTPIPPGEYVLYLEESERQSNKAEDGQYLRSTFVVAEGEYQGRKVFHRFNLWNKSEKSKEIAKGEWNAICLAALGQAATTIKDSTTLHFKKFIGTVKFVPPEGTWAAKNEMVFRKNSIRPVDGSAVGVAAPQANTPSPASTATPQTTTPISQTNPQVAAAVASAGNNRPAWAKR